jgi:hypothetical protein
VNAIVIEHVPVDELPEAWREKLAKPADAWVTVRIEEEARPASRPEEFATDDPAFGIWRDRDDMTDVGACMRKLREPRYRQDNSDNNGN